MTKFFFDDIILWSQHDIKSIRFNDHIFKSKRKFNIEKTFLKIFNYLKTTSFSNLILIVNENMFVNKDILKSFATLKFKLNYQILQLGLDVKGNNEKYDKIFSIGAFILNLKNTNLKKFEFKWNDTNKYLSNIYTSQYPLFLHPIRYKKYYDLRVKEILNNFSKIDIKNREFKLLLTNIENVQNPFTDGNNPFYFLKQVKVSKSLQAFEKRIKKEYVLKDYYNNEEPCLFFGLYNLLDVNHLQKHKGKKYILWGGSDIDKDLPHHHDLLKVIVSLHIDGHYAISKNIKNRLDDFNFKSKLVNFTLVDKNLFKPLTNFGDKIYIYNGSKPGREYIYGEEYYNKIIKRFPETKFILSSTLNKKYEDMPEVYKECFIGLRLTKNDGNANTVQEMGAMNIPVIHNGDEKNSLSWKTVDDIELKIRYRNIDLFTNKIKKFNKILFICSDYPGYGGAATNCMKMIEYYRKKCKNVYGIFYQNYPVKVENNYGENIYIINEKMLLNKMLEINPDLIILRNYLNFNLKKVLNIPIYFLIAGIFEPHLDKYYSEIKKKKEMDLYIHKKVLNTIKFCDESYCASYHTMKILKDYYQLNTNILYFNYIPFYNKFIPKIDNFSDRRYEFGVIVSDFNRKVKNLDNIIQNLKLNDKKKIFIGKNSKKYQFEKVRVIDLITNKHMIKHYKDIKYIVQDSFYESCSNVYVESRFYGCKFINLDELIKMNGKKISEKIESKITQKENSYDDKLNNNYNIKFTSNFKIDNLQNKSLKDANNYINNLINSSNKSINKKRKKYKTTFKLLYFINIEYLIRKMSRVRFHAIEKLVDFKNIELYFTGPGWYNYDNTITFEENVKRLNINFDYVILYKPLDNINNYNKNSYKKLPYPICIRYNEMWDEIWTKKEINLSYSNLIICHHKNDYDKYTTIYKDNVMKKFVYNPHHANPDIFYQNKNIKKEYDILLAGKSTIKHYPLRFRLYNLIYKNIDKKLKNYKILVQQHPGYNNNYSYTSQALKDYAKNINKCYLCIGGTSKYNYRLGKYVEIAMCGSLVLGDLPYEDKFKISKFTVEINIKMSDDEILNKIILFLNNKRKLNEMIKCGLEWSKDFVTEKYNNILYENLTKTSEYFKKLNYK